MTVYILIGIIILQYLLHFFERRDLYNRIMSRNLNEYKGEAHMYTTPAYKKRLNEWRKRRGENET